MEKELYSVISYSEDTVPQSSVSVFVDYDDVIAEAVEMIKEDAQAAIDENLLRAYKNTLKENGRCYCEETSTNYAIITISEVIDPIELRVKDALYTTDTERLKDIVSEFLRYDAWVGIYQEAFYDVENGCDKDAVLKRVMIEHLMHSVNCYDLKERLCI